MKQLILLLTFFFVIHSAFAQTSSNTTATVSYVLGMGGNENTKMTIKVNTTHKVVNGVPVIDTTSIDTTYSCSSQTNGFMSLKYNYATGALANYPNNTPCTPSYTGAGLTGSSTLINGTSIAYNPADQNEYYFVVEDTTIRGVSNIPNTYVYRWPIGTCPTKLAPIAEFPKQDLLPTFDNSGNTWAVGTSSTGSPYTLTLQQITFNATSYTSGPVIPLNTGSAPPVTTLNGDFVFTPSGQMFLIYNNEEFALAYQNYASNPSSITATYVATLSLPNNDYLVGLGFAGGSMIGAISQNNSIVCNPIYDQINMLTGAVTPTSYLQGFNSNDNSSVTSGIGSAKSVVSVTPNATAGQYTVVYNVYVQDYGNFPVSNIQVSDNLGAINHAQNVVSVATQFVGTPPPAAYGLVLDPTFNGTTQTNLLKAGGSLPNYPVAQANFTIQVTVVLNSINAGVSYFNTAVASGTGFNGDALTDTSTNGTNPDPNGNSRPDDPGEDVPTPFEIQLTAQSAPCTSLPQVLFQETFGHATGLTTADSAGGTSQYTGTTTAPVATNDYTIASNANKGNSGTSQNWISLTDHTGNSGGDMMLVNADEAQDVVYQTTVNNLCANLKYSFNAYVANISDTAAITFCNAVLGYQPPNLQFQMVDASTQQIMANLTTGPIWAHNWTSYGMRITLPATSGSINLQVINVGGGGCGNDFALDDISFGLCDPQPSVVIDGGHAGCLDSSTTLAASIADTTVFNGCVAYQWQDSVAGSPAHTAWTTIPNATSVTYTIPVVTLATPTYYRVNVAPCGETLQPCSYTSAPFFMQLKTHPSTPINGEGTLTASTTNEGCAAAPVTLTANGFTLGDGAQYLWFTGSCGGDTIKETTTNTITVAPSLTTTYYVMAAGACNATQCAKVTITNVCALPTDLLYFHGSYSTGITTLTWEVTDNQNITGFYVERSVNGTDFSIIDSLDATSAVDEASYTLSDNVNNIDAGTITYRLIMLLKGGGQEESPIVAINKPLADVTGVVVYPNPAANQLTIAVNSNAQQQMSYAIISMQGQILLTGNQVLVRGQNSVNVNGVQILPSGAYIVRIQLQDGLVQKKLIIQK